MKKNLILIIVTIVLGAVAIFTGVKIYQSREEPVAPTQPKGVTEQCRLVLDIPAPTSAPTATPTPTPTPTPTLTPMPTPTPIPECWQICVNDDNCPQDLACQTVNEEKRCVNPECPEEKDCQCPVPTATPTPTLTPTLTSIPPTATPQPTTAPQATATPQPTTVYVQQPTRAPLAQAPTATPTPPTELPEAGSLWPTIGVTIGGIILGIIGLLLAL